MFKKCGAPNKLYIGRKFVKDVKELDPREAYMYLGIDVSHDIEHKIEKQKLKKEYFRGLRLVFSTDIRAKNKIRGIRPLAVPVLL
jgi:hypothetical protein